MGREGLDCFRKQLTERLNVLIPEADTTINGMTGGPENSGDPADQASADGDQTLLLRMRERERKLIEKIRGALERIEEGTYGFCEECGEEISEKRLMARPFTTLCIDCKTSQEEDERRRGAYLKR